MTWLFSLIMGAGVPARFAKPVAILGLFAALLAVLAVAKCSYDRSIINAHEAKQEAANAKADRKADTHAAEQRRTDDARSDQEQQELQKVTDNAKTDLDRRLAFQRCLRLQQSARAAKRKPPTCS